MHVHCVIMGNGKKIIHFLPGIGLDHTIYKPLLELLAQDYTVKAYDVPPFGKSTYNPREIESFLKFVNSFKSHIDAKKDIIIGHSLGALIASYIPAKQHIYLMPPTKPKVHSSRELFIGAEKMFFYDFMLRPIYSLFMLFDVIKNSARVSHLVTLIDVEIVKDFTNRYNKGVVFSASNDLIVSAHPNAILVDSSHNYPVIQPKDCYEKLRQVIL